MDILGERTRHMPDLRCFACGVCGSPEIGDTYISALIRDINVCLDDFRELSRPRITLYLYFLHYLQRNALTLGVESSHPVGTRNIDLLSAPSRNAFLLHAVEGFTLQEMASILALSSFEAEKLVAEANQEIESLVATDVLIIEDEPMIAMDIESIADDLGHRVVGVASTHKEATALAKQEQPGLILSDIQLADGSSGVAAVAEILEDLEAPVSS